MTARRAALALAASAAIGGGASPPAAAQVQEPFTRGVSDARLLLSPDAAVRRAALARAKIAGASVVRLSVGWRAIVDPAPPPSFDATDPDDPSYDFSRLDAGVRDAVAAGLEPLVMVTSAPDWAEAGDRWEYAHKGTWAPRPAALADLAVALGRRYSGSRTAGGAPLPRVRLWQVWNEPNLPRYLQPQWVARRGRWIPYAPGRYRAMLAAFSRAMRSIQPDATIATAGTAPVGEPRDGQGRMSPIRFWASLLCVTPDPPHRRLPCRGGLPRFDVAAHHPLSVGDPDRPATQRHDVAIADLGKLRRVLAAAGLAPRLWITELNWDAEPRGVVAGRQARYVARGLRLLDAAGAGLTVWHLLADPPPAPHAHPAGLWQDAAGLRPRRFLAAFALPFSVRRLDRRRVEAWAAANGSVRIERRVAGRWRRVGSAVRTRGGSGRVVLRLRGSARLRARSGGRLSPVMTVQSAVPARVAVPRLRWPVRRAPTGRGAVDSPDPPAVSPAPPIGGADAPPSPLEPVAPGRDRG